MYIVGGDGVILHASYLFKRAIPPVSLFLNAIAILTRIKRVTIMTE